MKGLIAVTCAVAALAAAGCGQESTAKTTCEQAAEIVDACGKDGGSLRSNACSGNNQAYSKCAVDNKAAVCSGLSNPTNASNAFNACVSSLSQA